MTFKLAALTLVLSSSVLLGCDPETCPAIDGTGASEEPSAFPDYTAATEALTWQRSVLETDDPAPVAGTVRIAVDEVEHIETWTSYACGEDETVEIVAAHVRAEVRSPDGAWSLILPATVADADTDAPQLRFAPWTSEDPAILATIPDTDLADDAEVGRVEIEVSPDDVALYRTDMVSCTMVEGCSNTTRHLVLRWSHDDA